MKNWFLKAWETIKGWLSETNPPVYLISRVDDIPGAPENYTFYLVGEGPYIWCGVMRCPCGCGEVISLNLLPEGRPKWSYKIHQNDSVTIYPSIWRVKGCRSHFFLQRGNVNWVTDQN